MTTRRRATRKSLTAQETSPQFGPGPAARQEAGSSNRNIPTADVAAATCQVANLSSRHILRLGTDWETFVLQEQRLALAHVEEKVPNL